MVQGEGQVRVRGGKVSVVIVVALRRTGGGKLPVRGAAKSGVSGFYVLGDVFFSDPEREQKLVPRPPGTQPPYAPHRVPPPQSHGWFVCWAFCWSVGGEEWGCSFCWGFGLFASCRAYQQTVHLLQLILAQQHAEGGKI